MAFCWCTLHVNDMARSLAFYQKVVGLSLETQYEPRPSVAIAFLGDGETKVELVMHAGGGVYPQSDQISLGFTVDSVEDKLAELRNLGISIYKDVVQPSPSIRFFYIKDPDGISIQFVEHLAQPD